MKYLSAQDILAIHARVIHRTNVGTNEVRDVEALKSLTEQVKLKFKEKEAYPGVFVKAAYYMKSIIKNHIFVDGNKRTGFIVASRFLSLNGYEFTLKGGEAYNFIIKMTKDDLKLDEIAARLKKYSKEK